MPAFAGMTVLIEAAFVAMPDRRVGLTGLHARA
jgi:hypothetical protein